MENLAHPRSSSYSVFTDGELASGKISAAPVFTVLHDGNGDGNRETGTDGDVSVIGASRRERPPGNGKRRQHDGGTRGDTATERKPGPCGHFVGHMAGTGETHGKHAQHLAQARTEASLTVARWKVELSHGLGKEEVEHWKRPWRGGEVGREREKQGMAGMHGRRAAGMGEAGAGRRGRWSWWRDGAGRTRGREEAAEHGSR